MLYLFMHKNKDYFRIIAMHNSKVYTLRLLNKLKIQINELL